MKIIAEIGLNHSGDADIAKSMARVAAASPHLYGVTLQIRERSYYDGSKPHKFRLEESTYSEIRDILHSEGKSFGLAVSDLYDTPCDFYKVLSKSFYDFDLVNELCSRKKTYVSTGNVSLEDILECKYPAEFIHTEVTPDHKKANLNCIDVLKHHIDVAYGLHSDHCLAYAAVAKGISSLFFYLKSHDPCPDPQGVHIVDMYSFLENVNKVQEALGDGCKNSSKTNE